MTERVQEWSEKELQFRSALARALWKVDNRDRKFDDVSERRLAFAEEKSSYVVKANQVMRHLRSHGLDISAREFERS